MWLFTECLHVTLSWGESLHSLTWSSGHTSWWEAALHFGEWKLRSRMLGACSWLNQLAVQLGFAGTCSQSHWLIYYCHPDSSRHGFVLSDCWKNSAFSYQSLDSFCNLQTRMVMDCTWSTGSDSESKAVQKGGSAAYQLCCKLLQ